MPAILLDMDRLMLSIGRIVIRHLIGIFWLGGISSGPKSWPSYLSLTRPDVCEWRRSRRAAHTFSI